MQGLFTSGAFGVAVENHLLNTGQVHEAGFLY